MNETTQQQKPASTQSIGTSGTTGKSATLADNRTGLPTQLKAGMESVSGMNLDHVRVHYNSPKPAQLNAHAYAQGNQIHLGAGQEKHLPHELGHVVQQAKGQVKPTAQFAGAKINDDPQLESEASTLGSQAVQAGSKAIQRAALPSSVKNTAHLNNQQPAQLSVVSDFTWSLLKNQLAPLGLNGILTFADTKTLEMLSHYDTFQTVVDSVTTFSNTLSLAVSIWERIPAPVRTGILFITGKALGYLPSQRAIEYSQNLLVDADHGGGSSYLLQAVNLLKIAIDAANHPVSSAFKFGQYIYTSWWNSGETAEKQTDKSTQPEPAADRKKDLAKLDLHIIWVNVKSVQLEKTEKDDQGATKKHGGLHAAFGLGYRLFSHQGSIGQTGGLVLILPWEGGAILESNESVRLVNQIVFGNNLFVVKQLDMTTLHLNNHGLEKLSFYLKEFSVGNNTASATNVKANYKKGSGLDFGGKLGVDFLGWQASAILNLLLDDKGEFKSGDITSFKESSGQFTVGKAGISKEEGFELEKAKWNLNKLTGLDLAAEIEQLKINQQITGKGKITGNNIPLLGDSIKLEKVDGSVEVQTDEWTAAANAIKLAINFAKVKAGGTFSLRYNSKERKTHLKLSGGYFNANYDGFSVNATELSYDHDEKKFDMKKASLTITALDVKGDINDVSISQHGVNFSSAVVSMKEQITLFEGFTLEQLRFIVGPNGSSLHLKSDVLLKRAKITGSAKALSIGFSGDGFEGSVASAEITTPIFGVDVTNASISKNGLHVDDATLKLNPERSSKDESSMQDYVPSFNMGLLDFLPIGPVAFKVTGVDLNKAGLKVQSFRPKLDAISLSAFGIHAGIDLEKQYGELGVKKNLSLAQIAAGMPLKVKVLFPIFPGLEAYGSLGADANLGVDVLLSGQGNKGEWSVGDHATFTGSVSVTAELGVNAGSELLFALGAGVFAKGEAKVAGDAKIKGAAKFNRKTRKFDAVKPFIIDYSFKPEAIASIGVVVKAKAFYFFEKKIFEYTAAEWRIGKYDLVGKIGSDADGMAPQKPQKLGLDGKPNPIDHKEIQGEEAKKMLESDTPIAGSGEARKKLLQQERGGVEKRLQKLQAEHLAARKKLDGIAQKYVQLIHKKDQYFQALIQKLNAEQANVKLEEFNRKYKVEALQEQFAELKYKDEETEKQIQEHLQTLAPLASINENHLETHGLKHSLDTVNHAKQQTDALNIENPDTFEAELDNANGGLEAEQQHNAVVLSKVSAVMGYNEFVKLTTTKHFIGIETTRKSIKPVDTALANFHHSQTAANLRKLLSQIKIYLGNSSSGRTPYVLLLETQAKEALKVLGD